MKTWAATLLCIVALCVPYVVHADMVAILGGEYGDIVRTCLEEAGIGYEVLDDSDLKAGKLQDYRIIILTYNPQISEGALDEIQKFVLSGGKVFCFYTLNDRIADLLGLRYITHLPGEYEGQFAAIRFKGDRLDGMPKEVAQNSWNINVVEPAAETTVVLAEWHDRKGKGTGYPALTLSPNGVYMSHVLLGGDLDNKRGMLIALIGHFLPQVWEKAASTAIGNIGRISDLTDLDQLGGVIAASKWSGVKVGDASKRLKSVRKLKDKAEKLARQGKYWDAIDVAVKAQRDALKAYCHSQPSKVGEFRGVWIPTAYGVSDWGWKKSIKVLAKNGFNAVLPNMLWAGLAHYKSRVLPVSERVSEEGDQIAECVKWGRKYGVEVHPWKVNYNLSRAPEDFIEKLRSEGRTQKDKDGQDINWLCPSHPDNFALELESMLEVVRNYDVDGIHFDYIRYPHGDACYCEGCKERFEREAGVSIKLWPDDVLITGDYAEQFYEWRQDQITKLVKAVSEEARKIKPHIKISAAVFRNWRRDRRIVGQDWKLWVEKGYLDFVCPMDYTTSIEQIEEWVRQQVDWVDGRIPLYIGIGSYRLTSPDQLIDQIQLSRNLGADGFVLFEYNAELGERSLSLLRKGISSAEAIIPHNAPEVDFELPEGLPELEGYCYLESSDIPVKVRLRSEGKHRYRLKSAEGRIELRTIGDGVIRSFGELKAGRSDSMELTLKLDEGLYRLAVGGTMKLDREGSRPFIARSRIIRVLSESSLEAELAKYGPPKVEGEGLRVGVFHDGYGSTGIFAALSQVEGLLPFYVYNFGEETLKVCQVLIIPQPKDVTFLTERDRRAIRNWVESGGGLLVTHDMVGFRWLRPIIPEVCRRGLGNPWEVEWTAAREHPITEGLEIGGSFTHSYYDRIILEPGEKGKVLITGEGGEAILISGDFGEGRYIANGMCTGLNVDDTDMEPQGAERILLINAVRWLGKM